MQIRHFKRKLRLITIFLTVFAILITALFIFLFEHFAMPIAEQIIQQNTVTRVNAAINNAVKKSTAGLSASDLYSAHFNTDGKLTYLEVNSIQINLLCGETAQLISQDLNKIGNNAIKLPIGTLSGINMLAHCGPSIPINLSPAGSAEVDYETTMESAGIGQVNFKVWLVVNSNMNIVNPLIHKQIDITRKLMLVNTVFSGEVPNAFYGERVQNQ